MRNFLALIGIISLVALLFVPLVSADEDFQVYGNTAYTVSSSYSRFLQIAHPSAGASISAVAAYFGVEAVENGTYLTTIYFTMRRVGDPVMNLTAKLYGGGDVWPDQVRNGTLYDTSITTWNSSVISTDIYAYPFTFNSTYQLLGPASYFAVVEVSAGSGDADNYIEVYGTGSTQYTVDTASYYSYSTWNDNGRWVAISVKGNIDPVYVLSTDPTPTPYPSGTTSSTDGGDTEMDALVDAILPWLVPLLICLIPALLGYKFVGELGFFIGLNVGCILAYVTLASTAYAFPLWGIILVGVMDVAVVLMRR